VGCVQESPDGACWALNLEDHSYGHPSCFSRSILRMAPEMVLEEYHQNMVARVLVLRMRSRVAFGLLSGVIVLTFGSVGLLEPSLSLRAVAIGAIAVVLGSVAVLMRWSLRAASHARPGILRLTDDGVRFECGGTDIESTEGFIPWGEVGKVSLRDRWDSRRVGVRTLAILCVGRTRHPGTYPGPREFSDSIRASWLNRAVAETASSRIEALAVHRPR
jgi:hypothetical protein